MVMALNESYTCIDCVKIWTKYCPYRTRNEQTEVRGEDKPCAGFVSVCGNPLLEECEGCSLFPGECNGNPRNNFVG
jgi:hypothetical protein